MDEKPKRRWFRDLLGFLLVVLTSFCIWLAWQLPIVRERQAVLAEIRRLGPGEYPRDFLESAEADTTHRMMLPNGGGESIRVPLARRLLGDRTCIRLYLPKSIGEQWINRADFAFPEAVLLVGEYDAEQDVWNFRQYRDSLLTASTP